MLCIICYYIYYAHLTISTTLLEIIGFVVVCLAMVTTFGLFISEGGLPLPQNRNNFDHVDTGYRESLFTGRLSTQTRENQMKRAHHQISNAQHNIIHICNINTKIMMTSESYQTFCTLLHATCHTCVENYSFSQSCSSISVRCLLFPIFNYQLVVVVAAPPAPFTPADVIVVARVQFKRSGSSHLFSSIEFFDKIFTWYPACIGIIYISLRPDDVAWMHFL